MGGYSNTLTLTLPAAVADGICLAQTRVGAGALAIDGSLATDGVASLVTAQRVGVTSAANDSARTFTIVGTDRYGRAQSESVAGTNASTVYTTHDFLTVASVSVDDSPAGNVTLGTVGVGSTAPVVVDRFINPPNLMAGTAVSGTVTYSLEQAFEDFAPDWDLAANSPIWYAVPGFSALTGGDFGSIAGPMTMLRLTITAGTGTATANVLTPFVAGSL